ncbi:polyprotein [Rhynchospora pubera]|uniref:Polyprotein n=1 Tax=Rhynchospora pubera TaxID=906938 RepID=A0AAV8GU51_9POAL|nr:polyprotein [Rhynchospora pubera]
MPKNRSLHSEDPKPDNPEVSFLQQQIADLNSKLADMLTPASLPTFLTTLREELRTDMQQQLNMTLSTRPTSSVLGPLPQPTLHADHKLRLHFPRFASGDPTDWLFSVQQYFTYYATPTSDWLLIASMHLDAPAARWYQGLVEDTHLSSWQEFTTALQHRFGPSEYEDPIGQLSRLTQIGSVLDYQSSFEELASRARSFSQEQLQSIFIAGLQPRIRRAVQCHRPRDLHDAFALARLHEAQLADSYTPFNRPGQPRNPTITPTRQPQALPAPTVVPPQPMRLPIKRLSTEEMQLRRQQGLCFNCDDKFAPGHRCKGKSMLLYLEGIEADSGDHDNQNLTSIEPEEQTEPEISLNALLGRYGAKSMRMLGHIQSQPVQVLVDSGSTNNFISRRAAQFLNLTSTPTQLFRVRVGNGEALQCTAYCQAVSIYIQSYLFTTDLFILDLEGSDVVLGVQWLETLGPILTDWSQLTMDFTHNGKSIHLQGNSSPFAQAISSAALHKLIATDGIGSSYMCLTTEPSDQNTTIPNFTSLPPKLQTTISTFSDLFAEPQGLPPSRPIDHRIPLNAGTDAVNVKPYRYPHFQKSEIEKLVADLLQSGAIRPSSSAFSSPVLLVRKKDGTWRFCVDYRALNAVTIRDRFPIPTVDELFDELNGATVFSKLDLRSGYHQIRVHEDDIHKTAFRTHHGHFEFRVMPFGLSNAPSTFQALMNEIFQPLLRKFVVIFFDDILVYSGSLEAHLEHLSQVFQILRSNQLVVKPSKCTFAVSQIAFLGHIISASTVAADPDKLKAIADWPTPTTQRQLRGFLGLAGYYRRFVHRYASIAGPLTDLLSKDKFLWSESAQEAFLTLKTALISAPVHKGRLYLPTSSSLIPTILADYHSSLLGGHSGFQRTFKRLAVHFLWKGMRTTVQQFVNACDVCQKCKPTNHFPYGLLQPLPIPTAIWTDLSMDFITHLPPSAAGMTPFEATYGRKPPSLLAYCAGSSALEAVDQDLTMRDVILNQLRANLSKAQNAMKIFADKKRKEHDFQQGDLVLLKLQPFRQLSLRKHSSHKLSLRFYGPYKILERLGPVAYRLDLPPTSRIHPVFHCSLLKPYKGSTTPVIHSLPATDSANQPAHVPIAILQHRTILRGGKEVHQVLIQWSDLALEEASWEDMDAVDSSRLADKSSFQEGGDVRPIKPIQVYARRPRQQLQNTGP